MRSVPGASVAVLFLVLAPARYAVAQTPSLAGNWKMNVAKSKYTPRAVPKSESVMYEPSKDGFAYKVTITEADGSPTNLSGALHFDGKDVPTTGSPDYDTVASRRIDAYTSETTRKKNGKVVQTVTRVLSTDGKTLTLTTKGTTSRGETINNVGVYERQP